MYRDRTYRDYGHNDEEDYWVDGVHYTIDTYDDGSIYELVQDMDGRVFKETITYPDGKREVELYSIP